MTVNVEASIDESITHARDKVIKAFKKRICEEMGLSGTSMFVQQTLGLAWQVADAIGWEPYQFCRDAGFQASFIAQMAKRKGCPGCGEWMTWDKGDDSPENRQMPSWVCLNHGLEVIIPSPLDLLD